MLRIVATAALAAVVCAPPAAALGPLCPAAVPGFDLDAVVPTEEAAVGLVVPDAGPTTSEARARRSLLLGDVRNSLRGKLPARRPLIRLCRPARDAIVGIPKGGEQANDRRYAIAVNGGSGLLISESTRIPGLVSIADVAHPERLSIRAHDDPVPYLRALDDRIRENGRVRLPAAVLAAVLIAALALFFPRAAVLAFATVLGANLLLGVAGVSSFPAVLAAVALGAVSAVPLAFAARAPLAVALVFAAVVAAYGVAMAVDPPSVALSPLGPSQNGRFYGISNLLATMLLVPALAGTAVAARRIGWLAAGAFAAVALTVVAASRLGADGGGALVLATGYVALTVGLVPPPRRALAAGLTVLALAAVVAVAVAVGPSTHVTESLSAGPGSVARDALERIELSYLRATLDPATAVVVAASIVTLGVLVARGRRDALALAFATAIAVSLLVNDSPREVALGGLVGYLALDRFTRAGDVTRGRYNLGAIVRGAESG